MFCKYYNQILHYYLTIFFWVYVVRMNKYFCVQKKGYVSLLVVIVIRKISCRVLNYFNAMILHMKNERRATRKKNILRGYGQWAIWNSEWDCLQSEYFFLYPQIMILLVRKANIFIKTFFYYRKYYAKMFIFEIVFVLLHRYMENLNIYFHQTGSHRSMFWETV